MGLFIILASACKKEEDDDDNLVDKTTGVLEFKMIKPNSSGKKSISLKSTTINPLLLGDTTHTILKGVRSCIGDIWVSQGEVKAGHTDDLEWIRLTDVTNTQLRLFEDYSFAPKEVPAGTYRSIKITIKKVFYWHTELASDSTVKYELLQTNAGTFDPCDENDTSWVKTNYFSTDGNHTLDDDGVFELASAGEKVGGFTVEVGGKAIVNWRWLMEGCAFYLLDLNHNLVFDCGVDDIEMECPSEYMFDFVVEYE